MHGTQASVFRAVEAVAAERRDRVALVFADERLTYGKLMEMAKAFATACGRLELRPGDRVVVCLPNWPEYVVAFLGCMLGGFVFVPLNPRLRRHEIRYITENSGAKLAVCPAGIEDGIHLSIFQELLDEVPSLQHLVAVSRGERPLGVHRSFQDFLNSGERGEADTRDSVERDMTPGEPGGRTTDGCGVPSNLACIVYTSGTTGLPKGAMLTHDNLLWTTTSMNDVLQMSDRDVSLIVVPLCHIFGLGPSLLSALLSGATVVLVDVYKPETVFQVVERERVTVHHAVPTMFILELNHESRNLYDLSSLRIGIMAAAPCPVEVVSRIRRELGMEVIVSYGLTETSPALTATRMEQDDWVYETVGRALPGIELKVVGDLGETLGPGEIGELCCKSPGLMAGYYRNSEATREAIDEGGWFHTGDLATIDENGYVRIVGRKKEMINRGGLKIYPREVEEWLYKHPAVREVAIVGVPDPVLTERTCACVTLKEPNSLTPEDIQSYCRSGVADYKVPDIVEILDELPHTSSGKIAKLELAAAMKEKHPPVYRTKAQ